MEDMLRTLAVFTLLVLPGLAPGAEKYSGPRPPKPDLPYLLHADNLVATETGVAKAETRKDYEYAVLDGATSPVKTPLAEPIFIIQSDKLAVSKLAAYKLEVKNGKREVVVGHKNPKNVSKPLHLNVTRLDDNLYRVELDQPLENGEYALSPEGSNDTFSFQVY